MWAPTPPAAPTPLANGHGVGGGASGPENGGLRPDAPRSPFLLADEAAAAARAAEQPGLGLEFGSAARAAAQAPRPERLAGLHALLAGSVEPRLRHLAFVALMRLGGAPATLFRDREEDELAGGMGA